jgi:hypothetical protein
MEGQLIVPVGRKSEPPEAFLRSGDRAGNVTQYLQLKHSHATDAIREARL